MEKKNLLVLSASLLLLTACNSNVEQAETTQYQAKGDTVQIINQTLIEKLKIEEARSQPYSKEIITAGTIKAIPTQLAYIAPPFTGRVIKSCVKLGQQVEKGTPLFEISSPDTLAMPVGTWDKLVRDFDLADLICIGLENRIDLIAMQKNIEISTNEYKLTRAERLTDIGLSLSYERDWKGFLPPSRNAVTAGVSIPLQFSNTNKGAIKAAKYRINQSDFRKKEMELQVQTEISRAWYSFEAKKKKVNQYKSGMLGESQKVLDGMVYKYQRGETSILDVLIAQRTHNEVREQYLETTKAYASALVEQEKVCGVWDVEF